MLSEDTVCLYLQPKCESSPETLGVRPLTSLLATLLSPSYGIDLLSPPVTPTKTCQCYVDHESVIFFPLASGSFDVKHVCMVYLEILQLDSTPLLGFFVVLYGHTVCRNENRPPDPRLWHSDPFPPPLRKYIRHNTPL